MTGECFQANYYKVLRKPACRSPLDCHAELRAEADQQTGGGSVSTVLQCLECILVRAAISLGHGQVSYMFR